ncbi:hypothetical protein N789_05585 [Arenimonas oryziterrae DSM 21050 = YC6267]|uniref:Uncharacterized protein n=1 Tax=Arenimonas oryziterrae DSM 21050 = YC6267 TaxID=1121015 RepID=A0A091APN9_9GAMM|nr:hypothetical protein N789_05585 [Arenimonas oryziterrae DSM 21050 = YC6267]
MNQYSINFCKKPSVIICGSNGLASDIEGE